MKYEVKELGTTGLRGGVERRRSRKNARGINSYTREEDAPIARRASVTCMEINIAAFLKIYRDRCSRAGVR